MSLDCRCFLLDLEIYSQAKIYETRACSLCVPVKKNFLLFYILYIITKSWRIIAFLDQRQKKEYRQTWEKRHWIVEISKQTEGKRLHGKDKRQKGEWVQCIYNLDDGDMIDIPCNVLSLLCYSFLSYCIMGLNKKVKPVCTVVLFCCLSGFVMKNIVSPFYFYTLLLNISQVLFLN